MSDKKSSPVFHVRAPRELHEAFSQVCEANHISMTATILQLVEDYVEKNQKTVRTLKELTGKESGIVVYGEKEAIVCNWSGIEGFPRIFATGLVGLGEEIPKVSGGQTNDVNSLLAGVHVINAIKGDLVESKGTIYHVSRDVKVITPDGWV